ncbi:SMI1/KNR4 family protein [Microbispora hainanensis]|uniref:Knr4/Smi1-like domain-containing protein n=1 Tax=Microbispora hainanensis TaxID=568844 RepID=A0A544Z3L2_9ACTN|nr:SMI1/KNR4 family protein [Microbispora hainanensis]TQS23605.1 hypothetical protein FLX08_03910 [Microbispora hainanensis]
MRRLIVSRPVRLALAVALVAGVAIGLVAVRRRRIAVQAAPRSVPPASRPAASPQEAGEPAARGPEPVLGRPTSEDLARYDRPEAGAPVARLLEGLARIRSPHGRKARRWTAALVALGLLVLTSQVLESAVFGTRRGAPSGLTAYAGDPAGPCLADGCPMAGNLVPSGGETVGEGYVEEHAEPCLADACGVARDVVPSTAPVGAEAVSQAPSPAPKCVVRRASATPVVRPISRRVTTAVNRQWRRIERWLKAHAPRTYASLNGPATRRLVASAEARMGTPIPDSLRASLLRHNGARGTAGFRFSPYYEIMGARGLVSSWPEACRMGGGIPFAYGSDAGDYLVTNSATGGVGSADWETPYFEDEWPSYYALLKATADGLAEGGPVGGWIPVVRGGVLDWK